MQTDSSVREFSFRAAVIHQGLIAKIREKWDVIVKVLGREGALVHESEFLQVIRMAVDMKNISDLDFSKMFLRTSRHYTGWINYNDFAKNLLFA